MIQCLIMSIIGPKDGGIFSINAPYSIENLMQTKEKKYEVLH